MRYTQKPVGKEKTRKTQWDLRDAALAAVILASGVWMIIAGLMKLWGRIEKPGDELGFRVSLRTLFSANKMSTQRMFPHLVHPLTSVFSMRRLKVLLVEDDEGDRLLYCYMLAVAGYKVNAVRNGLEAFAEILVNRPDVIVTDIAMPVLSGLDLIAAVRSNDEFADLPVVAITSFGEKLLEQARATGATDAIDKPIDITSMREVIEAAVSRSRN